MSLVPNVLDLGATFMAFSGRTLSRIVGMVASDLSSPTRRQRLTRHTIVRKAFRVANAATFVPSRLRDFKAEEEQMLQAAAASSAAAVPSAKIDALEAELARLRLEMAAVLSAAAAPKKTITSVARVASSSSVVASPVNGQPDAGLTAIVAAAPPPPPPVPVRYV